jgi:Smg protein
MKENVVDVLMFLFDNYLSYEEGMPDDEMTLAYELEEAGFDVGEITQAFDWLGDLADLQYLEVVTLTHKKAMRIFTSAEQRKLDVTCLSYLLQLEDTGFIDVMTREMIIERAMVIPTSQIDFQAFKRIVGLVMLNSPQYKDNFAFIEDLVCDDVESVIH